MKSTTSIIGKNVEQHVKKLYVRNNYTVLAENYRYNKCEIDLILKKDDTIVFIEVKFRRNEKYGSPETFVSEKQQERISEAAENFIIEHNWLGKIRFDIVAVTANNKKLKEKIFHDVF